MKNIAPLKKNRIALIVCAIATVLALVIFCLPVHEFTTAVFSKKSGNTFVGDERYVQARAEVEAAAAEFEGAEIRETVTERVNSKGKTTSMVSFEVVTTQKLNAWQMMGFGFVSSRVLIVMAVCIVLAAVLAALSLPGALKTDHRRLSKKNRLLRKAACWMCLIALVLTPVFAMTANLDFSRKVDLIASGFETNQADAHLSRLDTLLFNGKGGEELLSLIKGVSNHLPSSFWLLIPVLFIGLLGYVVLSFGELGHVLSRGFLYFFVVVLCIFILYPFYVMLITGFRSNTETTDMHFLHMLPTKWVWSNIPDIISRNVLTYLFNSILLSTGATLIAMLCGIPAAYAMARMNFKGKKSFLGFVIMSQMFSPVVLLVGISTLMNTIRLNDSIIGLMLINAAFNQAFAIWLLRGTFVSISSEMEQAACIDGCNSVTALIRILLPMAAPGIVTTLIFVFINAWNEYTISTVLISTPAFKPITVGITQFSSFNMIEWHYLFAAALLATIPVVILFMCIEKHLVSGLTSGGVKG